MKKKLKMGLLVMASNTMSQDILQLLQDKPQEIFNLKEKSSYFNLLAKSFLDPLTKEYSVLDEIYVDGLDSTQVFGQTKMVLDGVGERLLGEKIPNVVERLEMMEDPEEQSEEDLSEQEQSDEVDEEEEDDEERGELEEKQPEESEQELEGEKEEEEEENELSEEQQSEEEENDETEYKKDAFGLNDGFFDIDEFNKQILAMEKDDFGNDDEDDEDEEEESDSDSEVVDYYSDFFGGKKGNKNKDDEDIEDNEEEGEGERGGELNEDEYAVGETMRDMFGDEDEEEEEESEKSLSSFQKRQRAIQAEIAKLEAELIEPKKWTMKGEVSSANRGSLLDTDELKFDRTAKPVPTITEESTQTLEALIIKRIKEEEFDDLPRRVMTEIPHHKTTEQFEIPTEKKSLAELYEDEYHQKDDVKEDPAKDALKEEISELFKTVMSQLDRAQSAYNSFEIKVKDGNLEDASLHAVGTESKLAPQEIYKGGLTYSKDEMDKQQKLRLRRAAKRKRKRAMENKPQENKKVKVTETLSKAKNITLIDKNGDFRDTQGNIKKNQSMNNFKL